MLSLPHWRFICKLPVQSIHIALECAATPYWVDPFNLPTESFHVNFAPTQLVTAAPDLSLPNYFVTACQLVIQTRKPSKQGFWWGSLNSESPQMTQISEFVWWSMTHQTLNILTGSAFLKYFLGKAAWGLKFGKRGCLLKFSFSEVGCWNLFFFQRLVVELFFFRGWLLTVGRRNGAASCGALLLPLRSINLIITITIILVIVLFMILLAPFSTL